MNPIERSVELEVPAQHRWIWLIKAVVSTCADPTRFDLDRLDDLSLLVGEVATTMIDEEGPRLEVGINPSDSGVTVRIEMPANDPPRSSPLDHGLCGHLLDAIASDIKVLDEGGCYGVEFAVSAERHP